MPPARLEGMITDPVYEGKSMQGMIDLVQKGFFPKGSKVLYAHLGGLPCTWWTRARLLSATP
jgi:1-aminocyclopropane-1-carboxylate deaminase